MTRFMLVCCVLFFTLAAFANDTAVTGQSGRVVRLKGEHAGIRMVNETVRMDIYPQYYTVNVDFLFKNDGPAVTVQMGFPETGTGDIPADKYKQHTAFQQFRTRVDDQEVKATRQPATVAEEAPHYETYWVKTVSFAANQQHRVRVSYRSPVGDYSNGEHFAEYDFTGGNWKDSVAESTLLVTMHTPGSWLIHEDTPTNPKRLVTHRWSGNQLTMRWRNWQAEGSFRLEYYSTYPGWMQVHGTDDIGLHPESARLLTQPGRTAQLDWLPPVVTRDGVTFIALRALADYLNNSSEGQPKAWTEWDPKTLRAAFIWKKTVLHFQVKSTVMQMADDDKITLPAPVFLSRPSSMSTEGQVYVPLRPVVTALGGTFDINQQQRTITLSFPR